MVQAIMQSRTKCVRCGGNAIAKNDKGQPTCSKHKNSKPLSPECPVCGEEMTIRSGRYGYFWGCSGYPTCQTTEKITTFTT